MRPQTELRFGDKTMLCIGHALGKLSESKKFEPAIFAP
jgi:hypothetical protein